MDADLWFQLLKVPKVRARIINAPLSLYRRHEHQKTSRWDEYCKEIEVVTVMHTEDVVKKLGFKMEVFLWKKILPVLQHRNTHPRLGLRAPGDVEGLKTLLRG
jgi:hypothetical protein